MSALLQRFRQKYPDYDDISDDQLTVMVGDKYPDYLDDDEFRVSYEGYKNTGQASVQPAFSLDLESWRPGGDPFKPSWELTAAEILASGPKSREVLMGMPTEGARQASVLDKIAPYIGTTDPVEKQRVQRYLDVSLPPPEQVSTVAEDVLKASTQGVYDDFVAKLGVNKQTMADAVDVVTGRINEPRRAPTKVEEVLSGTHQASMEALNFFTSPLGIATLGTGSLPAGAQRAVAAAFTADMLSHAPAQVDALAEAIQSGDTEKISKAMFGLGLTTAFVKQGAAHAMGTPKKVDLAADLARELNRSKLETIPLDEAAATRAGVEPIKRPDLQDVLIVDQPKTVQPRQQDTTEAQTEINRIRDLPLDQFNQEVTINGKRDITGAAYRLAEKITKDDFDALAAARARWVEEAKKRSDEAKNETDPAKKLEKMQRALIDSKPTQFFEEVRRFRNAIDDAIDRKATTKEELAAIEKEHGVGDSMDAGRVLGEALNRASQIEIVSSAAESTAMQPPRAQPLTREQQRQKNIQDREAQRQAEIERNLEAGKGADTPPEPVTHVLDEPAPATPAPVQEMVGMGAATPKEFDPVKQFTTSNKNAVVDKERADRGLPPMMNLERQSNQGAWDSAMRKIDENPQVQDELISELTSQPRAVTAEENAMLMHRRIDLRNEYEKALKRWREAFENDDMVVAAEESQRVREWSSKLSDLEDVTKSTGAESGRSLQARKMMANEDYSLAAMELRAMEAKGRNLTPQEHLDLIKAQEKIKSLESRLAELESGRESKELDSITSETIKETAAEAKSEAKSKDFDVDREDKLSSAIRAKVEKGQQSEITPLVQQLARVFWRRGIREREPMIDALHDVLKTIIPEITRDGTQRAFSGYGNFKPLSKEAIDVGLRDLRGQTQQVLKIEAIESKKPLEKTGVERRVPSDEERRLIKQVNELKRKYGVVVTDPATQLKSALQARKTYYEHRIADLKHEIETRQRIVKTRSPSPRDAELDSMIAEHERLKAEHESIFGKRQITDEQRLKMAIAAAERNQAHWESRLEQAKQGNFTGRQAGRKVTSDELEAIKARTEEIKDHVQELKDLDVGIQTQRQIKSLQDSIAEYERRVKEGELFSKPKPAPVSTPEIEALKVQRDEARAILDAARKASPEGQARERDARIKSLEDTLADLERKISEGDLSKPTPPARALTAEESELQKKIESARATLQDLREKSGMYDAGRLQKAVESNQAAIEELTRRINEGDIAEKPKTGRTVTSPELDALRAEREQLQKILSKLRNAAKPKKTPEQIALQSLKTRLKTQEADYRDRIARGDFAKRERKTVPLDAEATRLKVERDRAKEEFQTKLEQDRWNRMSVFQKSRRKAVDIYDAARAIMTTGEFSFVLRQGKLAALSHPIKTAKALPDAFRALLANEQRAREIDAAIHNHPDAPAARAAKLHLVEEGQSLHRQEEILMGRLVGKIPVVKNFNQAAQVFLNKVRFDMWMAMRKSMSKSGTPTPAEDAQIAMFVNQATGRGGLGKLEAAAVPLGRVMFSPRYYASRLQLASGHSMWGGTMRTRQAIATEYARALIGLGVYYTGLKMAFSDDDDPENGKVELDPRSTDFGKVQVGETKLDPLAGLSQIATLASRTATGEKVTGSGQTVPIRGPDVPYGGDKWSDIMARHLRGKLHPVPASVANLFDGTDMGGDEATLLNQIGNSVAPITYMDIYAALKEQDLDDGTALALLALFGEGLQTYKKKEEK